MQNNLYGKCLKGFLPKGNFRFIKDTSFVFEDWQTWKPDSKTGFILNVTLKYPESKHIEHAVSDMTSHIYIPYYTVFCCTVCNLEI